MKEDKKVQLLVEAAEDMINSALKVEWKLGYDDDGTRKTSDEWRALRVSIMELRSAIARISGKKKVKGK